MSSRTLLGYYLFHSLCAVLHALPLMSVLPMWNCQCWSEVGSPKNGQRHLQHSKAPNYRPTERFRKKLQAYQPSKEYPLVLCGKIVMSPNSDLMRQLTFQPNSLQPASCLYRKRGRPRLSWQSVLFAHSAAANNGEQLSNLLSSDGSGLSMWKQHLAEHLWLLFCCCLFRLSARSSVHCKQLFCLTRVSSTCIAYVPSWCGFRRRSIYNAF